MAIRPMPRIPAGYAGKVGAADFPAKLTRPTVLSRSRGLSGAIDACLQTVKPRLYRRHAPIGLRICMPVGNRPCEHEKPKRGHAQSECTLVDDHLPTLPSRASIASSLADWLWHTESALNFLYKK
jgi:hypothetical protein